MIYTQVLQSIIHVILQYSHIIAQRNQQRSGFFYLRLVESDLKKKALLDFFNAQSVCVWMCMGICVSFHSHRLRI